VGASRTDAGAHAAGQVAHVDVIGSPEGIQPPSLMMYLNGVLPDDVKVLNVQVAPPGEQQRRWQADLGNSAEPTLSALVSLLLM
jgi:tRNA U38,U39,U40 pseudouridine synthase TruA